VRFPFDALPGSTNRARLLDAIVDELVRPIDARDESGPPTASQSAVSRSVDGSTANDRQGSRASATFSQAGEQRHRLLGRRRQTLFSLAIMSSTTLSVKPLPSMRCHVPSPRRRARVELHQPLLGERGEELDGEERVSRPSSRAPAAPALSPRARGPRSAAHRATSRPTSIHAEGREAGSR